MNLATFAAKVLSTNIPRQPNKKDALKILPPQQKSRSYKDIEVSKVKFDPVLLQYQIGEYKDEWMLRYYVQLPFGADRKAFTKRQIEDFAIDYLKIHSANRDEKYVEIIKADINQIWYQFNIVKWFNDNFKSISPRFKPPLTLVFKYRNSLPSIVSIRSVKSGLEDFIESRFEEWMKLNTRKLRHKSFEFLRKIVPGFFVYKLDTQSSEMRVGLKYSVVLGSLALYIAIQNDRNFSKKELNQIKSRVGRLGDVKKLDRYLKRLR